MKKLISLILVLCLLLSLGISASAASTEKADITYRGIKLVLDGEQFIPCDEGGNTVEPFIMEGTTYLPVRALAQALGLGVGWDGKTSTVILTSGGEVKTGTPGGTPSTGTKAVEITFRDIKVTLDGDVLKLVNAQGETVEPFILDGTTYLPLRTISEALGLEVSWDAATSTVGLVDPDNSDDEEEVVDGYWVTSKETFTDGDFSSTETYKYDEKGNQTEYAYSDSDGSSRRSITSYDSKGNFIGEETYDSDGGYFKIVDTDTLFSIEEYAPGSYHNIDQTEYNANGDVTHTLTHDKLTGEKSETFYYYDASGRLESTKYYNNYGGEYSSTEKYTYAGNVRTNHVTDSEGYSDVSTTTFTYDAQGRVIKEVTLDSYGYGYTIESAFDSYGNEVYHRYDDGEYWWESRTEYDAQGNLILESYSDNDLSYTIKKEYNDAGLITHYEEILPTEGYWCKQDWTYDAEGNLLKERYEDNANYTETRCSYDKNGILTAIEVESAGEVNFYKATCNENGLVVKVVGVNTDEVFTCEYTYISVK